MTETQKLFKATATDYRQHDGLVTVLRPLASTTDNYDPESGPMFKVRSAAGIEFDAFADELRNPVSSGFLEAFDNFVAHGREAWPDVDGNFEPPAPASAPLTAEEVVQRVLNETPDGDSFDLNDALHLAVRIARGEA